MHSKKAATGLEAVTASYALRALAGSMTSAEPECDGRVNFA
jgi:hypothetical protein